MIKKIQHVKKLSKLENLSVYTTEWVGTTKSILIHTALFILCFALYFFGVKFDQILLILTTVVSLEAIYLALFIQMTVNRNTESLEDVEEDVEEIQEDVESLEGGFEDIAEDVQGLEGNIKKMRDNVKDLETDVEDISVDIDKIQLDGEQEQTAEKHSHIQSSISLQNIEKELITLSNGFIALKDDLEILKKNLK
ncbi:MAG: hypothetical protein COX79_03855 [Candidatus Levybacteria bacterium CG_4_10_14_0_2_um_filter_36_16]|nr:MAG: hypothetical protein AUK12_03450 [Candidatus Levybacteria bacterium CG2_30_37_29]PIR79491.1 MAG: hypothetical protein COU26_00835 [Candidatus Levybacteria bacterium CG10_big_fil_rev_8_21_14_0_10_36_30]PIZ97013.1 MAG: hypothetical protein COX79_03855 [Candidatus Levybacteria bacterium CG_4_10_14_0_2_um_filter_36_16]PJA90523.1 MAG: hypothetical protein CO136_01875 [Candidatus Levybacteria bacterium CG_4_9_14_3_um_filter_36_7]